MTPSGIDPVNLTPFVVVPVTKEKRVGSFTLENEKVEVQRWLKIDREMDRQMDG
jgi:hypothetical protein